MSQKIVSRVLKSYVWGGGSFALNFLKQLIIIPFILTYWGEANYSFWIVIVATVNILYTLNHGYLNYINNSVNLHYHSAFPEAKNIFNSAFNIVSIQAVLLIVIVITLTQPGILSVLTGIALEDIKKESINIAFLFFGISNIIFHCLTGMIGKLYEPIKKINYLYRFNFIYQLLDLCLFVCLIALSRNLLEVLTGISIFKILAASYLAFAVRNALPGFFPWWKGGSLIRGLRDFKKSIYLLISNFIERFQHDGLTLFISSFINVKILPVFATIRTISSSTISGTSLFINPTLPELQRFFSKGENGKVLKGLFLNFFISTFVINSFFMLSYPFIETLYTIWTKGILVFDHTFYILIAIYSILFCINYTFFSFLRAINKTGKVLSIIVVKIIIIYSSLLFMEKALSSVGLALLYSEVASFFVLFYYVFSILAKDLATGKILQSFFTSVFPSLLTIILLFTFYYYNIKPLLFLIGYLIVLATYLYSLYFNGDTTLRSKLLALLRNH